MYKFSSAKSVTDANLYRLLTNIFNIMESYHDATLKKIDSEASHIIRSLVRILVKVATAVPDNFGVICDDNISLFTQIYLKPYRSNSNLKQSSTS